MIRRDRWRQMSPLAREEVAWIAIIATGLVVDALILAVGIVVALG